MAFFVRQIIPWWAHLNLPRVGFPLYAFQLKDGVEDRDEFSVGQNISNTLDVGQPTCRNWTEVISRFKNGLFST